MKLESLVCQAKSWDTTPTLMVQETVRLDSGVSGENIHIKTTIGLHSDKGGIYADHGISSRKLASELLNDFVLFLFDLI